MLLLLPFLFDRIGTVRKDLAIRRRDDGYSAETIAVTALLVALAVAVLAILAKAITDKANDIDLNVPVAT